ncbi:ribosomal RNA small subunit methyltransferase A [Patescibacteria group bacterium]|nr:ribosomal RNA small subunit methyltransferase A [Patescibacteria group bacterium]MBU0964578.1 ribosomal RNA small subunit methyltransferase A [Patescibacteria group bacterium]
MQLTSQQTIKFLCNKYSFWPTRQSGQNFLVSEPDLKSIISSASISPQDTVLEIGAGFGTLTVELAKHASQVIAVELDKRLAMAMRKLSKTHNNLKVIEGDIFQKLPVVSGYLDDLQYKIVSNLPYNITSLVLRNFLENKPRPSEMVVLVQKEVADRIVAQPGKMSLLSIAIQFYAKPEIIRLIPRENFWPTPKVNTALLKISGIGGDPNNFLNQLGNEHVKKFFRIVKFGFSAKRKQLHNNLSAGLDEKQEKIKEILEKCGINPQIRAQDLSIFDWIDITHSV